MTPNTPRIPFFFNKRRIRFERVTAFGAEEVVGVPGGAERGDDFAFDGRFAVAAARAEVFVVVEVAVEARLVGVVAVGGGEGGFGCSVVLGSVGAVVAGGDAGVSGVPRGVGLGVEGDVFECCGAVVAAEAGGVEEG